MKLASFLFVSFLTVAVICGCGGEPELQSISGKVTLGGESYERIIVYFRPVKGQVNKFNMGVGETDANGTLGLRTTAGAGIAPGNYRVSFSYAVIKGQQESIPSDEKVDEQPGVEIEELVPDIYTSNENTPVEFLVESGKENIFEFDIPTKN